MQIEKAYSECPAVFYSSEYTTEVFMYILFFLLTVILSFLFGTYIAILIKAFQKKNNNKSKNGYVEQIGKKLTKSESYYRSCSLLYLFFLNNLNQDLSTMDIKYKYKDFGFSRNFLNKNFDKVLQDVATLAKRDGYIIKKQSRLACNKRLYTLFKGD